MEAVISMKWDGMPRTPPVATSGLPVALSVKSGPATISGNMVTVTGVGTVVLAANQGGSAVYNPATEVTTSFTVSPPPTPIPSPTPVPPPPQPPASGGAAAPIAGGGSSQAQKPKKGAIKSKSAGVKKPMAQKPAAAKKKPVAKKPAGKKPGGAKKKR